MILQWEHVPGDLQRRIEEQAALVKDFVDSDTVVLWRVRAQLEAEVGAWSDLVSAAVLIETVVALIDRCTVNRSCHIPYIAGYSRDGKTVFIDRHMPAAFASAIKRIKTDRFLVPP